MKIRINLVNREVEFEGDLTAIKDHFGDYIEDFLDNIKKGNPAASTTAAPVSASVASEVSLSALPDSFGEFYGKFPKGLSNVDKLLLAGYYLQNQTEGKYFTVKSASDLLLDQGVSLSNAGAFNSANMSTKRVFKLTGKNFRVSDTGADYIKSLSNH